jgi:T-complex protein 1 subunit eta
MDLVQKTVGGTIYSTLEQNLNDLGTCELFQDKTIGDDRYCILSGCKNPKRVTLVLRGSSEEVLQEAHRSIHDAICILANAIANPSFIVGGGAIEFMLKNKIEEYCMKQSIESQRAFALNSCIQAFGKALIYNAITLCENGCLNVAQVVQELEMLHKHETNRYYGVDIERGCAGDLYAMSIFEPTVVKRNALMCAVEAACLILSIDYVIKMPQEETEEQKGVRMAKEHRQQQLAQRQWKQTASAQQKDLV